MNGGRFEDRSSRGGRGGRGGFGRRDFGDRESNWGGGFRRDYNSQHGGFQTPKNVASEVEVEPSKETFNPN